MGKSLIILGADFSKNALEEKIPKEVVTSYIRGKQIVVDTGTSYKVTIEATRTRNILYVYVNSAVNSLSISINSGFKISSGIYLNTYEEGQDFDTEGVRNAYLNIDSPWNWHKDTYIIQNIEKARCIAFNLARDGSGYADILPLETIISNIQYS